MAARGRVALVVEEHDAEVGAVVVRGRDEAAVHVGVTARLVDQQVADIVDMVRRPTAALEDRAPFELGDPADHDPERLAGGVVVDRFDLHDGGRIAASSLALTAGHSSATTL